MSNCILYRILSTIACTVYYIIYGIHIHICHYHLQYDSTCIVYCECTARVHLGRKAWVPTLRYAPHVYPGYYMHRAEGMGAYAETFATHVHACVFMDVHMDMHMDMHMHMHMCMHMHMYSCCMCVCMHQVSASPTPTRTRKPEPPAPYSPPIDLVCRP